MSLVHLCKLTAVALLVTGATAGSAAEGQQSPEKKGSPAASLSAPVDRPWWLGDLITVSGIAISAGLILFQLHRQGRNALNLQRENHRDKLRLDIYGEFASTIDIFDDLARDASMSARFLPLHLNTYRAQAGRNRPPVSERALAFNDRNTKLNNSAADIIYLIERYEIVSPNMKIFQMAIGAALHDVRESFGELAPVLSRLLPMDVMCDDGVTRTLNVMELTDQEVAEIRSAVDVYIEVIDRLCCYTHDLRAQLQENFLGPLFANRVTRRNPIDPKYRVITANDPAEVARLKQYFENETAWGRAAREAKEAAARNVS